MIVMVENLESVMGLLSSSLQIFSVGRRDFLNGSWPKNKLFQFFISTVGIVFIQGVLTKVPKTSERGTLTYADMYEGKGYQVWNLSHRPQKTWNIKPGEDESRPP